MRQLAVACCLTWACSPPPTSSLPSVASSTSSEPQSRLDRVPLPRRLALGKHELCLVLADELRCWLRGQPELEHHVESGSFTDVAVADSGVCVLDVTGRVSCRTRAVPPGPTPLEPIPGLPTSQQIAGAGSVVCARSSDQVWCFEPQRAKTEAPARVVEAGSRELLSSGRHFCSVAESGHVKCWNRSRETIELAHPFGRVVLVEDAACDVRNDVPLECWPVRPGPSRSAGTPDSSAPPIAQTSLVVSGEMHACALTDGVLHCWGNRSWGAAETPEGLGTLVEIAASDRSTCALTADSRVYCWGELNPRFRMASETPVEVRLPAAASKLVASDHQNCARVGARWHCWGQSWNWGSAWQVGGWPPLERPVPHRFGPTPLPELDATSEPFMGGGFLCWSDRGSVSCLVPKDEPVEGAVEALETVRLGTTLRAWAGADLVCLEESAGDIHCFRPHQPDHPALQFKEEQAMDVRIGPAHLCVLTRRELYCQDLQETTSSRILVEGTGSLLTAPSMGMLWRAERGGTVALEWSLDDVAVSAAVTYPKPIVAMAGFLGSHCALLADASVWCRGRTQEVPTQVLTGVAEVMSGQRSFCARKKEGGVWCWGDNSTGQLGLGETPYTHAPRQVYPEH
jgi:hypothetical protein